MKTFQRAVACLCISLLVLIAGAEAAESGLRVYVLDCVGLEEGLLDAMRAEVELIFEDVGVRLIWRDEWPSGSAKANEARVYIVEELPPSLRNRMSTTKRRAPMAIALGSGPKQRGAEIYISRKAVLERASHGRAIVRVHMARAFGRTMAHELAHRFLRSGHTENGILKADLLQHDLIDFDRSDLFFTAEQKSRLQEVARGS